MDRTCAGTGQDHFVGLGGDGWLGGAGTLIKESKRRVIA
jgi:hypothetical protein